jgi:hypothetical protein
MMNITQADWDNAALNGATCTICGNWRNGSMYKWHTIIKDECKNCKWINERFMCAMCWYKDTTELDLGYRGYSWKHIDECKQCFS